jgi:hypothetical protein
MGCKDCKWGELDGIMALRCHYNPPRGKDSGRSVFAVVDWTDWCSKEEAKEVKAAPVEVVPKPVEKVSTAPTIVVKRRGK